MKKRMLSMLLALCLLTGLLSATALAVETHTTDPILDTLVISGLDSSYTYGAPPFELSVQGGSGTGEVSFVSSDPDVAQVSGNTVTILKTGSFQITATKAADQTYEEQSVTSNNILVNPRPVSIIGLSVADKPYDGLNTAELSSAGRLDNVQGQDQVTLISGTPTFSSVEIGDNIPVNFSPFSLAGVDAGNYHLVQPTGITANIIEGFQPVQDTHYTLNAPDGDNSWYVSEDVIITAKDNYLLSTENKDDSSWTSTLRYAGKGDSCEAIFYVRNKSSKEISQMKRYSYKKDNTNPEGMIEIKGNKFENFLNGITFGLFFKDKVDITISGSDTLSGVEKIQYFISDQVYGYGSDIPSSVWKSADITNNAISVSVDSAVWNPDQFHEKFFVYAKITDVVGNSSYLRSDGIVIYTDSTALTSSISFEKETKENPVADVNLNGNTVKTIFNGSQELVYGSDYTVKGSSIEFNASYLNSLQPGKYAIAVHYNPAGMDYTDLPGNSKPLTTLIDISVECHHRHGLIKTKVKESTCSEEGYTGDEVCEVCGETVKKGKSIPKIAHNYKEGKCVVCGAAAPDDKSGSDSPQTGDDSSSIVLWLASMLTAGAALTGILLYGRRKKYNR